MLIGLKLDSLITNKYDLFLYWMSNLHSFIVYLVSHTGLLNQLNCMCAELDCLMVSASFAYVVFMIYSV